MSQSVEMSARLTSEKTVFSEQHKRSLVIASRSIHAEKPLRQNTADSTTVSQVLIWVFFEDLSPESH